MRFDLGKLRKDVRNQNAEDHLILAFQRFQIRWGEIKNEDGELVGVLGEFFLPYLPWFKIRLPMTVEMARKIVADLDGLIQGEA